MQCLKIIRILFIGISVNCVSSQFVVRLNYGTSNKTTVPIVESGKTVQNNKREPKFDQTSFRDTAADFVSGIERFLETLPAPSTPSLPSSMQNGDDITGKVLVPSQLNFNNISSSSSSAVKGIGSETANPGQFPFIASLKRDGDHICGGIILDGRHVITAAHCFGGGDDNDPLELEPFDYSVTLGEHDLAKADRNEQDLSVERICVHPQYEGIQGGNDIAIIRLRKRIRFFGNVAPARLPGLRGRIGEGVDVQKGTADVAGWGTTGYNVDMEKIRPNILQTTHLFLFPQEECTSFRGDLSSIICAGDDGPNPRDVCAGDSGSPLICSGSVCGLVSYGARCLHNIKRRRGVYTRVAYFSEWISTIGKNGRFRSGMCYNAA